MGILSRKTKEVFCEPLLPSSLPYVKVDRGSKLKIVLSGRKYRYTNYKDYKKLLKGRGYSVYSIEDLSRVIGSPILGVKDNLFLYQGKLVKIYSLSTLCQVLGLRVGYVSGKISEMGISFYSFLEMYYSGGIKKKPQINKVTDYQGNTFNSVKEFCDFYGISVQTYHNRVARGITGKDLASSKILRKVK